MCPGISSSKPQTNRKEAPKSHPPTHHPPQARDRPEGPRRADGHKALARDRHTWSPHSSSSTVVLYNSSRADQNLVLALTPALDMASCALSPALVHNLAIRRSLTLTPAAPHQTPTSTSGHRRSPQAPMRRRGAPQAATAEPAPHIRRPRFSEIFRDSQRFSKKPPKTNGEISRKTFRAAARIARQKNSQRFSRRVISTAAWIGSLISVHFFGFQRFSEIFRDSQRFQKI